MVTPTGAAIAASLADEFLEMGVTLRAKKSGYGSGKKDFGKFNCLRVLMMDNESENYKDRVVLLETNIDDASGEMLAHAMEKLFDKGAKDVYFTPIIMKKNRPATMLSVLCDDESAERLKEVIFRETTAIGVREQKVARTVMKRESFQKQTSLGEAKFKRCEYNDIKKCYPEYESVKKLAKDNHISYGEAYESLLRELL